MLPPLIGITGRKDASARLHRAPIHSVGETYIHAIRRVGGTPVIVPPVVMDSDWPLLVERLDGLLLSGGGDVVPGLYGQDTESCDGMDEERDLSELGLVRAYFKSGKPILGICRGHQVLNIALSGTLYQDIATHIPDALDHTYTPARSVETPVHRVTLTQDSRLAFIFGSTLLDVNSAHHQSVKEPGARVSIVGYAPDGVVEALEVPAHPFCLSVQWHPEAMVKASASMWPLFEAFVTAAR
ncbi:MAG: gamma-glutamyl-gamma-aminobutyrate hydrolase family protein [Anaerolineae bacterium]|nr:gamma-glutamyl-gamma-aminobutyrate hydrolase family protein [Anaerolineae bacterium]